MYNSLSFYILNSFWSKSQSIQSHFFLKAALYILYFLCNKCEEAYTSLFTVLFTATSIDLHLAFLVMTVFQRLQVQYKGRWGGKRQKVKEAFYTFLRAPENTRLYRKGKERKPRRVQKDSHTEEVPGNKRTPTTRDRREWPKAIGSTDKRNW